MLAFLLALFGGTLGLAGLGGGGGEKSPSIVTAKSGNGAGDPVAAPRDIVFDDIDDEIDEDEMDDGKPDMPDVDDDKPDMGGTPDMPDMDDGGHGGGMHDDMPDTPDMSDDHGDDGGHSAPVGTPRDDSNDGLNGDHGDHGDGLHGDDSGGHGGVGHDTPIKLPVTQAEINAFVSAVRNADEAHVHGDGDDRSGEHMQVMDLVDPAAATHIAIGHGSWFDPSNWHNGEVPGDNAKVVIPDGVYLEYDQQSDARLFTVRVDGQLDFATDVDSTMVVDTLIVAPGGVMTAGTADDPVQSEVDVEIIIANNGAIDTNWDPGLFSRGIISHGKTEIHGARTDAHEKVVEDPMAGDTSLRFDGIPQGWEVGDTIVIAGTEYAGHYYAEGKQIHTGSEDEVRTISQIDGNRVYFETPLEHDHDTPRADLKTSVANYSRNVTIKSEDGDDSEVYERGHVMLMHSDDVDVRYAAFEELGRTDKSKDLDVDGNNSFDSNIAGRYGLHLHRTGVEAESDPTILTGNAVFGSPGWGIVQHDSHAIINGNATFDTFGAGFVAESGNETGSWGDNIAIYAEGVGWTNPKNVVDLETYNIGNSGDGFWFQGRMVASHDNVAASVNNGFVYFHRGSDGNHTYDAGTFEFEDALNYDDSARASTTPITAFSNNETFAAREGLIVIKASPEQGHGIHSVFEGFTAWEVEQGATFEYTAHYILKDFDVIGDGDGNGSLNSWFENAGISLGTNSFDFTIINSSTQGFHTGIKLYKGWTAGRAQLDDADHNFTVVNPEFTDVTVELGHYDPGADMLQLTPVTESKLTVSFDQPFVLENSDRDTVVKVTGTLEDSLGKKEFPTASESYDIDREEMLKIIKEDGYFTADDGKDYVSHNLYFSDRGTGDIYQKGILIELDESLGVGDAGRVFGDATFKGYVPLQELKDIAAMPAQKVFDAGQFDTDGSIVVIESATDALWDALTANQGMMSEEASVMDHDDDHHDDAMAA